MPQRAANLECYVERASQNCDLWTGDLRQPGADWQDERRKVALMLAERPAGMTYRQIATQMPLCGSWLAEVLMADWFAYTEVTKVANGHRGGARGPGVLYRLSEAGLRAVAAGELAGPVKVPVPRFRKKKWYVCRRIAACAGCLFRRKIVKLGRCEKCVVVANKEVVRR